MENVIHGMKCNECTIQYRGSWKSYRKCTKSPKDKHLPCRESAVILLTKELLVVVFVWFCDELLMRTDFVWVEPEEFSVEDPAPTDRSPATDANLDEVDDDWVAKIMIFCPDDAANGFVPELDVAATVTFGDSDVSFDDNAVRE